jgi:hypothetical protein
MGLIQLPRLYFSGYTYWNPSTFNNNDCQPTYDAANARLDWTWLARHGAAPGASIDSYATQPGIVPTANDAEIIQENPNVPPAEWNFYGDNACGFVGSHEPIIEWPAMFSRPARNTVVSGFTDASGDYIGRGDPWIGLEPRLNVGSAPARLVDVDPVCFWSSQIFLDTFSLGDRAGGTGFTGAIAGRAHARWINLARNLNVDNKVFLAGFAGATFQFGVPAQSITFFDPHPVPGSASAQLRAALAEPGIKGVLVRFTTYLTLYFQGPAFANMKPAEAFSEIASLYSQYAAALEQHQMGALANPPPVPVNRAYSHAVGWIGPWATDELGSMPGGRLLSTAAPLAPREAGLGAVKLAPAAVECAVDPTTNMVTRLALDLGATTPERDWTGAKVDFGTLSLGLVPLEDAGAPVVLASIPYGGGYDQASYERTAGVIDIPAAQFLAPVRPADLRSHRFALWSDPSKPALLEVPLVAQSEARGVYVDQQHQRPIPIQLRYLGGKPPVGTRLCVAQYSPNRPFRADGWAIVSDKKDQSAQSPYVLLEGAGAAHGDGFIVVPVPYADDGNPFATVAVSVRAIRPGFPILVFDPLAPGTALASPPSKVDGVCTAFYSVVRVLPFHNEAAQDFHEWLKTGPTADLVTQRVFDEVFGTYFSMYPVMRFIRDPLQFQAWRGRILEATDPRLFNSATYMPVTRSLSVGQRRMLELWDSYLNGEVPALSPPTLLRLRRG